MEGVGWLERDHLPGSTLSARQQRTLVGWLVGVVTHCPPMPALQPSPCLRLASHWLRMSRVKLRLLQGVGWVGR